MASTRPSLARLRPGFLMKAKYLVLVLALVACSSPQISPSATPEIKSQPVEVAKAKKPVVAPQRIILMIGDGMGMNYVTAAAYANGGPLKMMSAPEFGSLTTHEYEFAGTDSAASATAFATGRKTHHEGVSVTPGTTHENENDADRHMTTVLEFAHQAGWKTGLVATSRIVHATPAAFAAHRTNRNDAENIALDFAKSDVDLFMGAGSQYFNKRKDSRDLLKEMNARGYATPLTVEAWKSVKEDKAIALFHDKDMPAVTSGERAMSLPTMVNEAVKFLDRDNPKGWVLMVEGSQIDWCGHALDASCAIAETLDFDDAVGNALTYARGRDDTLVVVTADHETGGLVTMDPEYAERFIEPLGGAKAVIKRAALTDPSLGEAPDPVMSFKLGARSDQVSPEPVAEKAPWGMDELSDDRFTLTWGHLSLASRSFWKGPDRFYGAHTVTLVPVFAEGPAARLVSAQTDNADLGDMLIRLVKDQNPTSIPAMPKTRPKNVILMIGDGYGFNSMALGNYALGELSERGLPVRGYVSTHGINRLVNDSAATATAMATGERTRAKSIGMVVKDGEFVPGVSVLSLAEAAGLATGLVTTTQLTHATPAAFFGARPDRGDTAGLAKDFVDFKEKSGGDGINVVVAGGRAAFSKGQIAELKKQGTEVRETFDDTPTTANVAMLLAPEGLAGARARLRGNSPQPSLAKMTEFAINQLSNDPDGFFLMVEGGQIDWKLHDATRDETLVAEIDDFDRTVATVREFAKTHPDTLVIVTADHDHTISILDNHYVFASGRCGAEKRCGGTFQATDIPVKVESLLHADGFRDPLIRGDWPPAAVLVQYAWIVQEAMAMKSLSAPHSAHLVPLFASGPWSDEVRGYVDQPEIGRLLHTWANGNPYPNE